MIFEFERKWDFTKNVLYLLMISGSYAKIETKILELVNLLKIII